MLRQLHPWINNYNDVILFLLQSNMDVKYIGSGPAAKALVYYISDYITKCDLQVHAGIRLIQTAMQAHVEIFLNDGISSMQFKDRNLLTKCVNSLMARQEISHQQVMSYLVGGGDYYTRHTFTNVRFFEFINTLDELENRDVDPSQESDTDEDARSVNGAAGLQTFMLKTNVNEVSVRSDFLDYIYRPETSEISHMCLWEYFESMIRQKFSEVEITLLASHKGIQDDSSNTNGGRPCCRIQQFSS